MYLAIFSPGNVFLQIGPYPSRRLPLEQAQEVVPSGKRQHLYLGIKSKMIDLQAPGIVTKPGTEEQARPKWEGKFRLDSGGQCKPEPRTNFSWGGGS